MSLFAKLAAGAGRQKSTDVPSIGGGPGTWSAALIKQDTGTNVNISGPHPLSQAKVAKGTVCRVSFGESRSFLFSLNEENVKQGGQFSQISISARLWDSLGIAKDVREVEIEDISATDTSGSILSEIVLSIKDRYVSRRDLWMFQIRLLGCVVYRGFAPPFDQLLRCSSVCVEAILGAENEPVVYGMVGPQTRVIVRSNSAQICLIVNVSKELWTFDSVTLQPVFTKVVQAVSRGIEDAISRGKNHFLTITLSGRLTDSESLTGDLDLYDVIFEGPLGTLSPKKLRSDLIEFFNQYPSKIGWKDNLFYNPDLPAISLNWFAPRTENNDPNLNFVRDTANCACAPPESTLTESFRPSKAVRTNLLESINLCISHFAKHHLDRKLNVTGTQITIITANCGALQVDDPSLVEVSRVRLTSTSCAVSIVSVGPKQVVTSPTAIFVGSEKTRFFCPWLSMSHFQSDFPTGGSEIFSLETNRSFPLFKPPAMTCSLAPKDRVIPEPFVGKESSVLRPTDGQLLNLGLVSPRLQRVAVEASIKASDIKPIDNWIVQGEGFKTLHDLIGIRLSLDMQMVDISGSETVGGGSSSTPPLTPPPSESLMTESSAFGVKVNRASMRDTHIQKVFLRGGGDEERSMWMLNRLDSGNVYVSKVSVVVQAAESSTPFVSVEYNYMLRRLINDSALSDPCEIIACKSCQSISCFESLQTTRFMTAPPMPWNVLDEIISNPFVQQTLPSTVPYNAHPVPPELEGFRWKLRSSVRTGLFCLILPNNNSADISSSYTGLSLGQDFLPPSLGPVTAAEAASNFLDWLRKVESILSVPAINVTVLSEKQKRVQGFRPLMVNHKTDWFNFHYEQQFQFPRVFIFSIEWILCNSAIIEDVVSKIAKAAQENDLRIVRLPHAQLFPPPCPEGESQKRCIDDLPFHPKITVKLPERTKPGFYNLLLSRLLESLGMVLLFSSSEECVTEGIFIKGGTTRRPFFSREPSWILMTKNGHIFVDIKAHSVEWFSNHTVSWGDDERINERKLFLLFKQAVHTSLIDS